MGQVTIYLDQATEQKMKIMIKKMGGSKSKWIAGLIREKTADVWPASIKKLAGAWKDFPAAEEIRKTMGPDVRREPA
jgi:hypothetical protein